MRLQVLPHDRIIGVEMGGCPHTVIREDTSIKLATVFAMVTRHPEVEILFIENGGDIEQRESYPVGRLSSGKRGFPKT